MKVLSSSWFKLFTVVIINLVFFISWKFSFDAAEKAMYKAGFSLPVSNVPSSYIRENQNKIDVLEYDMSIELFYNQEQIKGDVIITGRILDKTIEQIDLNFYDNYHIEKVSLNGRETDYEIEDMHISVPLINNVNDTFEVRIVYRGTPEKRGLASFSFDEYKNRPVIYSLNEPIFASTWFPCNDKPDDKAQLELRITNDSSKVSLSNGKLIDIITKGNKRTYHWKTIYPISTYLICLYSADYSHFSDVYVSGKDTMSIDYYVFPEHREMAEIDFSEHLDYMNYFKSVFGEYPFIKEKYGVAEFLWQMGAMEHQTITGIGSNFLNGRGMFNEFYIHELAHQWFGNAVGPGTWKDIWLNEGFASYAEALYSEYKYGFASYKSIMQQKFQTEFSGTLYNPDYLFSSTVYDKGAWVVHMLRWELGDSTFFNLIRTYYDKYKYAIATTQDLLHLSNKVSGKNLEKFFDQWLFTGTGIIKMNYHQEDLKKNGQNVIRIILTQVQDGYENYNFPLEVVLKDQNGKEYFRNIFYIDKPEKVIEITGDSGSEIVFDPDSWLLAEFIKKQE